MDEKTDQGVRARWREALRAVHAVTYELEGELQARHDLGLSEFEVLHALTDYRGSLAGKATMKVLEANLYLNQSAFSRTVTRLERAGLVHRAECELDRRTMYLELTEAGRERWEAASVTQLEVLRGNIHHIEKLGTRQWAPTADNDRPCR